VKLITVIYVIENKLINTTYLPINKITDDDPNLNITIIMIQNKEMM
jgi:hypothetical protein